LISDIEFINVLYQKLESREQQKNDLDLQRDRCLGYLHKLFKSGDDNKVLLERINQAFKALERMEQLQNKHV